jgi:hypothetical protein
MKLKVTDTAAKVQIREIADDTSDHVIMCVGHNRGWEEAASSFAARPVSLQTSCTAVLQTEASTWHAAVEPDSCWVCLGVVRPEQGLQELPKESQGTSEGTAYPLDQGTSKQQPPAPA